MKDASDKIGYICHYEDLNKTLPDELTSKFQDLFSGDKAWRMNYNGKEPKDYLAPYGIDFYNPTFRDAVALDLVKLVDDDSVSNDYIYLANEHRWWSPMEYERWLMHRNYRINLVNLAPDFSNITYTKSETSDTRRTIDYMYQGIKMSSTLLSFFSNLLGGMAGEDVYSPVLNANDFSAEISLVPNTHTNFREVVTRAYYDRKYMDYRALMESFNISNIATFALVDPSKDKNHTGWFLVKVQRQFDDHYSYVVVKMDKDGRFDKDFGIRKWNSTKNEILSVCERDFCKRGDEHVGEVGDEL